jgi:hypothetical protein
MDPKELTPEQIADLQARNAALEAENAELKKGKELEPLVKEKMAAGLSREQAESVARQQQEHDAYLAKLEEEQKAKKKK